MDFKFEGDIKYLCFVGDCRLNEGIALCKQ